MATPESSRELGPERPRDTRDVYMNLLRLTHFPENTSNLPESFTIPFKALEGLVDTISLTESDGNERRQFVYWYNWVGLLKSKVYKGNKESVKPSGLSWNISYRILKKKALIDYHTHPSGTPIPSAGDILASLSGISYISIIATKYWITAMTETNLMSQRLSSTNDICLQMIDHYKDLEEEDLPREQVAAFLEKLGIGFYTHFSERLGGYKKKELIGGLKLTRVKYFGQDL